MKTHGLYSDDWCATQLKIQTKPEGLKTVYSALITGPAGAELRVHLTMQELRDIRTVLDTLISEADS
jgi:hypothetical protein